MSTSWDFLTNSPDLHGKVALVTGGNSGIGYESVRMLAFRGAKVYMASRTESKARQAISDIHERHADIKPGQVVWVNLDLSELKTVVAAADHVKNNETRLDIIINNACGTTGMKRSATGWEPNLAINHIGHFTLNNLLLPLIKSTARLPGADVRIVVVSSNVQTDMLPANYVPNFTGTDALENPVPYYPWSHRWLFPIFLRIDMTAYAVAKLANAIYARDLQRRLDADAARDNAPSSSSVIVTAVTPGMVRTPGMADVFRPWLTGLMQRLAVTPVHGAQNSLFAATAADVRSRPETFAGRYLDPVGRVAPLHRAADEPALGTGLWEGTERGINAYLREHGLGELVAW
ncbi:hypothetical protein ACHAQH_003030 [Verticillium albo-atrum]